MKKLNCLNRKGSSLVGVFHAVSGAGKEELDVCAGVIL